EIILRNVTVLAAPSFAFNDSSADFVSYIGCRVTPGPKPAGAAEARLKSSTADGIHSSTAKRGPLVENCLVENNGDDGIAIHGYFSPLFRVEDLSVTVGPRGGVARTPYEVGEKLYLVHLESGEYFGSAVIQSFKTVEDKSEIAELLKIGPTLKLREYKGYKEFVVLQLGKAELKAGESIRAGDIVCGANTTGNGFVVRNNTVRNLRARGINIKASEGIVEGNTADYCAQAGIIFCPGLYFLEAFFAQNVVIKNNLIRECGYAKSNPENRLGGAFTMAAEGLKGEYPAAGNHRNIMIEGNVFERCYGVNMQITSASGVIVRNNQFKDSHPEIRLHATKRGVDPKKLIWVDTTDGLELDGNTYEGIGPAGDEEPLYLGKAVANVKGAGEGLRKK
ncbi:MAG: right-handed parallel beta-helix repeat-containing protein, partial [Spirochaetia bacterium]|nr:right-handed parallel beta-helix repeat-containing protein [Spirochaetia bacterium]